MNVSNEFNIMFESREVGHMQRRMSIRPRFWVFVIAVMLLCFSASYAATQIHYSQNAERLAALVTEKLSLDQQVKSLTSRLNYVRTDAYVERVARDELNLIKPGEIRYVSN